MSAFERYQILFCPSILGWGDYQQVAFLMRQEQTYGCIMSGIQLRYMRSEGGFTLLELILVLVVTGILSSALIMPFISGLKQATRPEIYATTTYLAQKKIEELRSQGYTAAGSSLGATTSTVTKEGRIYDEQVVTEYVDHSGSTFSTPAVSTEFIRVTVTVSNPNISNVSLWTILVDDFYDPNAN